MPLLNPLVVRSPNHIISVVPAAVTYYASQIYRVPIKMLYEIQSMSKEQKFKYYDFFFIYIIYCTCIVLIINILYLMLEESEIPFE